MANPEPLLELDQSHLIGRGRTRHCYRHPLDSGKCIKVDNRVDGWATNNEALYYQKLARIRPRLAYTHIPRFYGFVETNLGPGGVFDLIQDESTGRVSKTFSHYIQSGEVAADDPQWLKAHSDYLETLYDEAIMIRDFNPGNLCARKMLDGSYQLVTIDGIGHRELVPVSDYFRWAARIRLRRQVNLKDFGSLAGLLERFTEKQMKRC